MLPANLINSLIGYGFNNAEGYTKSSNAQEFRFDDNCRLVLDTTDTPDIYQLSIHIKVSKFTEAVWSLEAPATHVIPEAALLATQEKGVLAAIRLNRDWKCSAQSREDLPPILDHMRKYASEKFDLATTKESFKGLCEDVEGTGDAIHLLYTHSTYGVLVGEFAHEGNYINGDADGDGWINDSNEYFGSVSGLVSYYGHQLLVASTDSDDVMDFFENQLGLE